MNDVAENLRIKIDYATEKSRPTHMCAVEDLQAFLAEIERLRAWVADLQSGMYVNCVYCGHRYGPSETTPVSMADALKAHIGVCPEHPMSGLLNACIAASFALKSYQSGNASPDLAKSVSEFVDAAIAKAVWSEDEEAESKKG